MDDPRSSRGREGGAQRDLTAPSDLGTKPGEWKDLGEVSRGQQSVYRSILFKEEENCAEAQKIAPPGLPRSCSIAGIAVGAGFIPALLLQPMDLYFLTKTDKTLCVSARGLGPLPFAG